MIFGKDRQFKVLIKTFFGFEPLLVKEIEELGGSKIEVGNRQVTCLGNNDFVYRANLGLRTALRVLVPIKKFNIRSKKDFYDGLFKVDWPEIFDFNKTFAFDTYLDSDVFRNSMFVSQLAKDALVDKFRAKGVARPNVDAKNAHVRFNIHIWDKNCTVSIDTSGASLHKRGYRSRTNIAPINEVLAAGLLLHSGWNGQNDLLDPMCGSGTFLIEAAMLALGMPPNSNRREFSFKNLKDYDESDFGESSRWFESKRKELKVSIRGFDKAPSAVIKANENLKLAGLSEFVTVEKANFFDSEKTGDQPLTLVFNPPYGNRLPIPEDEFYRSIGDTLKNGYPGSVAWMITSNLEALKKVGLRPSRKIMAYNGALESRWVKYELYQGSKKAKYRNKAAN